MPDREQERKEALLESEVRGMKLEEGGSPAGSTLSVKSEPSNNHTPQSDSDRSLRSGSKKSSSHSPMKQSRDSASPAEETDVETVGGDITVKVEPGKAPKLSRATSQKVVSRPPQLFQDEPDMTAEATSSFEVITSCIYGAKYLGTTEHALECDCAEEWDPDTKTNYACGEDSDCINRATKMECIGECGCGSKCQNQRFIRKQYANVTVFKTEKKGYGLRADSDLRPDDFIFEYIGEVINEPQFRRRMIQYDEENIKHFYFMSLSKGEFVDATKKGNLGRFCNHSCNPNCYVDKWVVGDKLRMGIFAERNIKAGEELVFNYNVDRYGANPQPCYCGEPNCTGFIGGKTQTERATKLSNTTIEALGIDDGDGWDVAVAKKPKRLRKTGEDDEEYVSNIQPKSLDEGGVTKVMATLMQCKEKWIAVKLLSRIQRCEEEKVRNRVVKMHGYTILKTALATWMDDFNVVLQVLDVLDKMPRITRNKIQDSKIEETVEKLTSCGDERVETKATELLKIWSKLEVGYRIPRMKRDPAAVAAARKRQMEEDRRVREHARSRSRSKSVEPPRGPAAPSGPKSSMPQRNQSGFFNGPRPPFRPRSFNPLPTGWFSAQANGRLYYYNATGETTWTRPTMPATQAPPPPPRPKTSEQVLQEIIDGITQNKTPNRGPGSAAATPKTAEETKPAKKEEKWRSYPEEKQKKLYENTLFPHIKYVMDKYKNKLPRDDLKRLAKDLGKNLVNSDFKHKRVEDPTEISSKQARVVRNYAKNYFDKAVQKKREHDKRKAEKKAQEEAASGKAPKPSEADVTMEDVDKDDEVVLSDMEDDDKDTEETPLSENPELKRKREDGDDAPGTPARDEESTKKIKTEGATPPPPPPPPPPPAEDMSIEQQEEQEGCTGGAAMDNADPLSSVQQPSPTEDSQDGATRNEISETVSPVNGQPSPAQLATPVTNGDDPEKELKAGAHEFITMKHKRPLGIVGDA